MKSRREGDAAPKVHAYRRNRNAVLDAADPCQWEPGKGREARLSDPFHASAAVRVRVDGETLRVCRSCAAELRRASPYQATPAPAYSILREIALRMSALDRRLQRRREKLEARVDLGGPVTRQQAAEASRQACPEQERARAICDRAQFPHLTTTDRPAFPEECLRQHVRIADLVAWLDRVADDEEEVQIAGHLVACTRCRGYAEDVRAMELAAASERSAC